MGTSDTRDGCFSSSQVLKDTEGVGGSKRFPIFHCDREWSQNVSSLRHGG